MAVNTKTSELIYRAAMDNQTLKSAGVKESKENIELYWKLVFDIDKMRKNGVSPSLPNS